MAQGLQIWDAAGKVVINTNYTTPKIVKIIDSGVVSGSYTPPFLVAGLWASPIGAWGATMPAVTVSGNTVSWHFAGTPANHKIIIGGY